MIDSLSKVCYNNRVILCCILCGKVVFFMKKNILVFLSVCIALVFLFAGNVGSSSAALLGDVDLNGSIDAGDAALILRYIVRLNTLSAEALANADANQDGTVNAADASAVLRYIVRLDTLPPSGVPVTMPPTPPPTATPTPTPAPNPGIGDADCNGVLTAADAAAILRYIVRLSNLSPQGMINADANNDGKITAADAAAILRYIVKLDTLPPATPDPNATPRPTSVPTNRYGGPSVGDEKLVVSDSDPNIDKIYNLVLNRRLSTTGSSYRNLASTNVASQHTIGWVTMTFKGNENGGGSSYTPSIGAGSTFTINEPILYRTGAYYLGVDIDDKPSDGGALISALEKATKNIVVTGHNSRSSRTHFHHLHSMQNGAKYYHNRGELISKVNAGDYTFNISIFGWYRWQVWAVYEVGPYESESTFEYATHPSCDATGGRTIQDWIYTQKNRSEMDFNVTVTPDDQFLTLYTCGDKYERNSDTSEAHLYVFLKRIN